MPDILEGYRKQKEYLICVDSDGCAMDTMFRTLSDSGLGAFTMGAEDTQALG